jgi:phage terminase large subunit GpA-like protein
VGRAGIGRVLLNGGSRLGPWKTLVYTVGVDTAKEDIFTSFRVAEPGTGYCHFSDNLPQDYFAQVTAEKLVKYKKDFVTSMRWEKTAERNEALDCFVYARAAVAIRRPNFRKLGRELNVWLAKRSAEFLRAGKAASPAEIAEPVTPKQTPAESESAAPPEKPAPTRRPRASAASQLRNALRGF